MSAHGAAPAAAAMRAFLVGTRRRMQDGVAALGLETWGDPQLSILAFGWRAHDMAGAARCATPTASTTC